MARARWVKPEFFTDKKVSQLSTLARLMFIGMGTICDDGWVCPADPHDLKALLFRYSSESLEEIGVALDALVATDRVRLIQRGDETFAYLPRMYRHHAINHPGKFRHLGDLHDALTGQTRPVSRELLDISRESPPPVTSNQQPDKDTAADAARGTTQPEQRTDPPDERTPERQASDSRRQDFNDCMGAVRQFCYHGKTPVSHAGKVVREWLQRVSAAEVIGVLEGFRVATDRGATFVRAGADFNPWALINQQWDGRPVWLLALKEQERRPAKGDRRQLTELGDVLNAAQRAAERKDEAA